MILIIWQAFDVGGIMDIEFLDSSREAVEEGFFEIRVVFIVIFFGVVVIIWLVVVGFEAMWELILFSFEVLGGIGVDKVGIFYE